MEKKNCWEFKNCGKQAGGIRVGKNDICPACNETRLHGFNDGINGGRACWVVPDTLCDGKTQGSFTSKFGDCMQCDFHKLVLYEEGNKFRGVNEMLDALK